MSNERKSSKAGERAAEGLREGGRGSVGGPKATRTRNTLVVAEVALAVVLLIGSVLLIQTFGRLTHVDTGFRSDRILTMEVTLPKSRYTPERTAAIRPAPRRER